MQRDMVNNELSKEWLQKLAKDAVGSSNQRATHNMISRSPFDYHTWVQDVQFTVKWVRAGRVEYVEKAKAARRSSGQQTVRNREKTFSYQLNNNITPEPPSTPDWRSICHNRVMDVEGTYRILNKNDPNDKGPRSLRYYTAQALAPYPENIKPAMLEAGAWKEGWIHVWNGCKRRGEDSYNVFKMFADEFAHEPDFTSHDELTYSGKFLTKLNINSKQNPDLAVYAIKSRLETYGGVRRFYLKDRLIEDCVRHRFEFLPHDTNIFSISKSLLTQKFNYITLLDLSGKHFSRTAYLQIITLPHLVGLDVTGCQIDRNILFCWTLAMRNGLWPDLRLLCIGQNDINGVTNLLLMCPTLSYIESDQSIDMMSDGREWERRHKVYDKIIRTYGRGNINKADSPKFARNLFPRHFGIGQKYAALKQLYKDLKKYAPNDQTQTDPIIVNPEFGVPYLCSNEPPIIQEFEIGRPPQRHATVQRNIDPIGDLWVDEGAGSNYQRNSTFIQEFFRIRYSPIIDESFRL